MKTLILSTVITLICIVLILIAGIGWMQNTPEGKEIAFFAFLALGILGFLGWFFIPLRSSEDEE